MEKEFTSYSTFTLKDYVVDEFESISLKESGVKPKRQKKNYE